MANYITEFKCKNCKATNWLTIEKGKSVEEYLAETKLKCEKCLCLLAEESE
jgi:hypothetical protein